MQVYFRRDDLCLDLADILLAITRMPTLKLSVIREELTEQCSSILYSYRRNCAAGTVPTQVCPVDLLHDVGWG